MVLQAHIAVGHGEDLRTAQRRAVNFRAFVRETGAKVLPVDVTDLSTDGCRFRSVEAFETATIVWLKIDGVTARQARIIWRAADGYGCEFVSPMQPAALNDACESGGRQRLEPPPA